MQITLGVAVWVATVLAVDEPPAPQHRKSFEASVPIRAITQGPKSHWFSYYDKLQFDPTDRYVLGMEVDFHDRTPTPSDVIRLGMIDVQNGDTWIEFGESRAWCWQQDCMLQWLSGSKNSVIYNDRQGDHYVSIIKNVFTGESRVLPMPIYTVNPDGKRAAVANFARTDDTRPGYGYKGVVDPGADQPHPANDGIHAIDLDTGESRLIISFVGRWAELHVLDRSSRRQDR